MCPQEGKFRALTADISDAKSFKIRVWDLALLTVFIWGWDDVKLVTKKSTTQSADYFQLFNS